MEIGKDTGFVVNYNTYKLHMSQDIELKKGDVVYVTDETMNIKVKTKVKDIESDGTIILE